FTKSSETTDKAPSSTPFMSGSNSSLTTTMKTSENDPQFPYIVSIGANVNGYFKHLCVGVIIDKEFVLSAAHCVKPPGRNKWKKKFVAAGSDSLNSHHQTRFFVVAVRSHPQYKILGGHDIGILRVWPEFPLDNVRFRALNFKTTDRVQAGKSATLLGWGRVLNIKIMMPLRQLSYLTLGNQECMQRYRFGLLTDSDICALHTTGPVGGCDGDSGGPLLNVKEGVLYGVLSYARKACVPNTVYAFTRISTHSFWIQLAMDSMRKILASPVNRTKWKIIGR
ncbi:hypothetical protein KR018_011889, partial [Drosophila ironensis]